MTPESVVEAEHQKLEGASPAQSFNVYRWVTLASLIIGYVGYYLCRANYSAAHDSLNKELGLSDADFGDIASMGTVIYAAGKFVGGPWTDVIGGRRIFFIGLFGSALASVGFGATGGVTFLFLFWGLNRAFQSLGWGGLMSVLSRWFTPAEYGRASGALSVSYQFGGVFATAVAGVLIQWGAGWRMLFIGPALMLIALGFPLLLTLKGSPRDVGYREPVPPGITSLQDEDQLPLRMRLAKLLGNPGFLVVCGIAFALTLIREAFNTWLPAYFSQQGTPTSMAVFKSTLFPLLGCFGTIFAGWLSDRYFRDNRGPIVAVFLTAAGLVLFGLGRVPAIATMTGLAAPTVAATLVGLTGFFILGPYSMVGGGVFALDYGGRQAAATAVGLLDGVGYLGGTLAGWGIARMVKSSGGSWNPVFNAMTIAVFLSAALSFALTVMSRGKKAGTA